ncbi:histone deacetylase family protein [candidate division KSB1 bacterium]|nr:histone deacetylase family protein [candidate division KSB1 bacterium]
MFRIRRIYDNIFPVNQEAIKQVQQILRAQFSGLAKHKIDAIPMLLQNPLEYRFRSILFLAEGDKGQVKGFALLQHAADLNFCFLDYISAAPGRTGGGIGEALYRRVREEALELKSTGLFFECLPDEPALCKDKEYLKQNAARLRFYERFGVRPIANTKYETPVKPDDDCPPYLMYDDLGRDVKLSRKSARTIVKAILNRKYGDVCPVDYVDRVVGSFNDDPVRIREPRYRTKVTPGELNIKQKHAPEVILVVNDMHEIHHVHERGYVESPVRIKSILQEIMPTGLFQKVEPRHFKEQHITAVHDVNFYNYFKKVCELIPANRSVYPYVFPIRNAARQPKELPVRAGYYCIDTFTPLNKNAFLAARRAADCALTAAENLLGGYRLAYALVRPPGHHAEHRAFGGFCYFNSAAIAAQYLSAHGKVTILDLDYHHGNGQQEIFYRRDDVQTISIHCHPRYAYPYFTGFADETGAEEGRGYNINHPLPETIDAAQYKTTLQKAIEQVKRFRPLFLILCLGLDTAKGDPTGSWDLKASDFEGNGFKVGSLGLPTLVVQEGGYRSRSIGVNARHFFIGLYNGFRSTL